MSQPGISLLTMVWSPNQLIEHVSLGQNAVGWPQVALSGVSMLPGTSLRLQKYDSMPSSVRKVANTPPPALLNASP